MSDRAPAVNKFVLVVVCASLLVGNGLLEWMVDSDLGIGWPHNAIRNWEQFGIGALHGKIVINPGGHDLPAKPEIYFGHRPMTLYPAWFFAQAFGWTGSKTLPFHAALSALTLFSAWFLMGRTRWAFLVAAIAIITPGFVGWPKILDPNTTAALLGIPYAAFIASQLRRTEFKGTNLALVVGSTLLFTSLNWTTILIHAQIFAFLAALRIPIRRLAVYVGAGFVTAILVVVMSVISKAGGSAGSGKLVEMLAGYTWGHGGYSDGSSTSVLLVRYAFTNALILLPIWIILAWTWFQCVRTDRARALWSLGPLAMAFLGTLGMRNYFCHHPWMAAPVLLVGAFCSLAVLRAVDAAPGQQEPADISLHRPAPWAALAAAFCFGLAVMGFYRERNGQLHPVMALLRSKAPRSEPIVLTRQFDAELTDDPPRSTEALDRYFIITDKAPDDQHPVAARLLLSSAPLAGDWQLLGQTSGKTKELIPGSALILDWFSKTIARRKAGDRLPDVKKTFYLYRVPARFVTAAAGPAPLSS